MNDPALRDRALSKVPEVTLGLLDHQDRGHDPRRDRWRYRHHDAELGLSRRYGDVPRAAASSLVHRADRCEAVPSFPLLGDRSSPRPHSARRWPILPTARSASATPAARCCCSVCSCWCSVLWYWSEGTISVDTVSTPKVEAFYWAAITFSQTLGTALGDWIADTGGLGYEGGALVFAAGLAVLAVCITGQTCRAFCCSGRLSSLRARSAPRSAIFSTSRSTMVGLALSRPLASAAIAIFIVICISLLPQRPGRHIGEIRV